MSKIIIILASSTGGELDRKVLTDVDPDEGTKITTAVIEFIENSVMLPGDILTVTEEA